MSVKNYFKDHLFIVIVYFLAISFTVFSLWALRVNAYLIIEITTVLFVSGLLMFAFEYTRTYRYFNKLLKTLHTLDKKYLVHELVSVPIYYQGRLIHEILGEANKAMLDHVNLYKHSLEDFKEYIELWVHEIKIPLASLRLIMETLPEAKTVSIESEMKRIEDYVEQVLFYARSENVEKDYIIKSCELDTMIRNVIKRNRKDFIYKKINLDFVDTNLEAYTDLKWMEFILNQIINNSIKYAKESDAQIKISAIKNKNSITLCVEDNGIGIMKNDLSRVFDKGFTGENGRSRYNSTGIGLYLCKSLCEQLHHEITIKSVVNQGVKVFIEFPISSMIDMIKN